VITRTTIDKIYQAAIIEDVIGDFVQLKRSGSAWKGLSPFANERTPSFFVVPSKGIYKDFSSGKGGNVVDFLMQHEKLSYPEALRWLAAKYQIDIEEEQVSEEEQQARSEREELSVVTEFAAKYFQDQLFNGQEGQAIGLSYFHERGFRDDIIQRFQLGYCPDQWDAMTKAAIEAQYQVEYLMKAGLTRERDGRHYDFFRGRVMFPIHNISGKVIAFGGRTLKAEKEIAKYFNSPESELYVKSNVLFGLHLAKNTIVRDDVCYLVEGYTDVISLHQAGIENVVASSGTSLTEGQIRLIRRYTRNITILYDGDSAGIKASFRGIDMILKEGMNVRVLLFPDGDDPDSFARKNSSQVIQDFIKANAQDFISFKTSLLMKEVGADPVKRADLIRNIVESIALIPDAISRNVFIQECSRLMNMQESVLLTELNKKIVSNTKKVHRDVPEETPVLDETPADGIPDNNVHHDLTLVHQERDFMRLLLTYGERPLEIEVKNEDDHAEKFVVSVAEYLITGMEQDEIALQHELYAQMYNEYIEFIGREEIPSASHFAQHDSSDIVAETSGLLVERHSLSPQWSLRHQVHMQVEEDLLLKASTDCLLRIKLRHVQLRLRALNREMEEYVDQEERVEELMREKILLDQAKAQIAKHFGSVIL
jgi:DNA primase